MGAGRGLVTGATLALLVACTGGDGGRAGGPSTAPSTAVPSSPSTTAAPPPGPATTIAPPPGSLILRARGVVLPDPAMVPDGLRLVVGPAPSFTVRRRGRVAVEVCPVDAGGAVSRRPERCARPAADEDSQVIGGARTIGVEVRQAPGAPGERGGPAALEELTVTYLPAGRTITVVLPARAPASCGVSECEATFDAAPSGPGTFTLEARPQGGRPQLSLLSGPADRPGSRPLATVEGGSSLSLRASVENGSAPQLVFRETDPGGGPALAIDLFWP